ncbi:hypothetical protein F4808DRAFT_203531 [Astrocystis sublimbata]|nr:hypothetical protein F4808DRAFT_203531 [Astrocystis sublimbata]
MKFQLSAALLSLAATVVSGQDQQSGPFSLHVKGATYNSKIDGYVSSCHTGAGISGLCYGAADKPDNSDSSQYYFNYTSNQQVDDAQVGNLVWNQPYTDEDNNIAYASQYMGLVYSPTSNVAAPMFGFSETAFLVGFNSEGGLFGYNYVDDADNTPEKAPTGFTPKAYYQWAVCWQYFTGYYYQSLAWIQLGGAPHNPTCELVEVTKVKN